MFVSLGYWSMEVEWLSVILYLASGRDDFRFRVAVLILRTEFDLKLSPCHIFPGFYLHLDVEIYAWSPKDAEGRTPVHVAISNQHGVIIQLLISHPNIHLNMRDRQGLTPFACAMTCKNNKAAEAILKRESGAAEQVSKRHPG